MSSASPEVLVCYLCCGGIGGSIDPGTIGRDYIEHSLTFCKSYDTYAAGLKHDLLLIQKAESLIPPLGSWKHQARNVVCCGHSNVGLDISSLLQAAMANTRYDYLLWLSSTARILDTDWLLKFYEALASDGTIGAVAATGSHESGISHESPNPHLRTSAIMFRPQTINSFGFGPVLDRLHCYEFEHGVESLYRKMRRIGMQCLVVGRNGKAYDQNQWAESYTYRRGEQENLLIADRQTNNYIAADSETRKSLSLMAGWLP